MPTPHCTGLPKQQGRVMELGLQGINEREMAKQMSLSVRTIKAHKEAIRNRWGSPNFIHAIGEGFRRGHIKYLPVALLCFLSAFGSGQAARPARRLVRTVPVVRTINANTRMAA